MERVWREYGESMDRDRNTKGLIKIRKRYGKYKSEYAISKGTVTCDRTLFTICSEFPFEVKILEEIAAAARAAFTPSSDDDDADDDEEDEEEEEEEESDKPGERNDISDNVAFSKISVNCFKLNSKFLTWKKSPEP